MFLVGVGGCFGAEPSSRAQAIVAVDDLGDTVRLVRPATRIVSLIPATTELLFALARDGQRRQQQGGVVAARQLLAAGCLLLGIAGLPAHLSAP